MKYFNRYIIRNLGSGLLLFLLAALLLIAGGACKKFIEVEPPYTRTTGASIYQSDATAIAVLNGIYTKMLSDRDFITYTAGISFTAGLSSDELILSGAGSSQFTEPLYTNNLSVNNPGTGYWYVLYNYIFTCNAVIEGLNGPNAVSPTVRQQLLGEAHFMRAFCFFYLVNTYGDVPLPLSTDYTINSQLARAPEQQVYKQIIADCLEAQQQLNVNYLTGNLTTFYASGEEERLRPTTWAAAALLARAYLYSGDYANAEIQSTAVIDHEDLFSLTDLSGVFKKNSKEAIWQLPPVNSYFTNTSEAYMFVIPATGPGPDNPVYLSTALLDSFETGDDRRTQWVGSTVVDGTTYYYPFKYKAYLPQATTTEYLTVLRLGEQYLIRAEARAHLHSFENAQKDLDEIRQRAGLPPTTADDEPSLLSAVHHERKVELFTEMGHRWFDLKRTHTVDAIMSIVTPLKGGGDWDPNQAYYPIPQDDILRNPKIVQNKGY